MLTIIDKNPFRVLGVFANAPKRDIVSNESKIKAFLKVGKEIHFPVDNILGLSKLNRSQADVDSALKNLERPIDRLKALLFWFVELTPLDKVALNHLTAGDTRRAIEIWSKVNNLGSLLNRATAYLITEDWGRFIQTIDLLFINSSTGGEICALASETLNMSSDALRNLYLETINAYNPKALLAILQVIRIQNNSRETVYNISDSCKSQVISTISRAKVSKFESELEEIERIAKDKISQKSLKVKALLCSSNLQELGRLLGKNSIEYSQLAQRIASIGIQCAIDLYNNSTEPDDVARRALDIANRCCEIAPQGSLVHQRCAENAEELNKICSKLPPDSVIYYHKLLKKLIDEYQNAPAKISSASKFISDCAPYLMSIRTIIGSNHKYYLRISTRIASDALGDLISDYNEQSENLHQRFKDAYGRSRENVRKQIIELMRSAAVAMFKIKQLNLELDFLRDRFSKNYDIIIKQANEAGAFSSGAAFGITLPGQMESFLKARGIDQRDEDGYYNSIRSLEDCYTYRRIFPNGKYSLQVNEKVEEYEYKECATLEDLVKFKVRYPSTRYDIEKKREEIIFKSCKTIDDYNAYLSKYTTYKKEAQKKIDDLTFSQCQSREQLVTFLKNNPGSAHRMEAQRKLDDMDYRACKSIADYEQYLKDYPHGCHTADARKRIDEETLWAQCEKKNSWKLYQEYLSRYPRGKHASEAKPKAISPKEKFKQWSSNNGCLLTIIVILAIALIIAAITHGVYGVGCVFGVIALCGVGVAIGKGDDGCGVRIAGLGVAVVAGAIALGLISWGEEIERNNKANKALEELGNSPTITDYSKFCRNHLPRLDADKQQSILQSYYQASLDSCYASLSKYSEGGYNTSTSGLGYLKNFIDNCNNQNFSSKAQVRYNEIVDSLYSVATAQNRYSSWQEYQSAVSSDDYRDSEERKEEADVSWTTEPNAWATASELNSIEGYQKYLSLYPAGAHKKLADKNLIDLQVAATFSGEHGSLPEMDQTSYGGGSTSYISVKNSTSYTLTLLYSGTESKRLELSPNSYGSIKLKNGSYRIAASVDASNVSRYAGTETLSGGSYDVEYYISTTTIPSYLHY